MCWCLKPFFAIFETLATPTGGLEKDPKVDRNPRCDIDITMPQYGWNSTNDEDLD